MKVIFLKKCLGNDLLSPSELKGYHRCWCVSRLCSKWEEVGPHRFSHQGKKYYNKLL